MTAVGGSAGVGTGGIAGGAPPAALLDDDGFDAGAASGGGATGAGGSGFRPPPAADPAPVLDGASAPLLAPAELPDDGFAERSGAPPVIGPVAGAGADTWAPVAAPGAAAPAPAALDAPVVLAPAPVPPVMSAPPPTGGAPTTGAPPGPPGAGLGGTTAPSTGWVYVGRSVAVARVSASGDGLAAGAWTAWDCWHAPTSRAALASIASRLASVGNGRDRMVYASVRGESSRPGRRRTTRAAQHPPSEKSWPAACVKSQAARDAHGSRGRLGAGSWFNRVTP
jgi:hypothetical protein